MSGLTPMSGDEISLPSYSKRRFYQYLSAKNQRELSIVLKILTSGAEPQSHLKIVATIHAVKRTGNRRLWYLNTCSEFVIHQSVVFAPQKIAAILRAIFSSKTSPETKRLIFVQITNNTTRGSLSWTSVLHRCISFSLAYKWVTYSNNPMTST